MKLNIKLVDKTLPVPQYQTEGSVAFDLYAREKKVIKPFQPTVVPLNLVVETPQGFALLLTVRSSLPLKKNLMVANGIGIIDQDYRGEKDELGLQLLNFSKKDVVVKKGERIGQALLVKTKKVKDFNLIKKIGRISRGGFGSTG